VPTVRGDVCGPPDAVGRQARRTGDLIAGDMLDIVTLLPRSAGKAPKRAMGRYATGMIDLQRFDQSARSASEAAMLELDITDFSDSSYAAPTGREDAR
jgi:hypothetical protein